ncbi:hypothetical protein Tco_0937232 [Tanacetum coccineum]|uniref:Uncharacterized protein n=1 Tax=Tanacetum coccineum TaxID=301880 RepID=A0ABQ5DGB1_9ASTR
MKGLKALQSHFTSLLDDLKDIGGIPTFKRTFSQDMDLLEKHLTNEILHEIDYKTVLRKLRIMFENTLHLKECLQNYTALETYSVKDSIIEDLKGTRIEHGFKWAFMSLFGQDDDTFTSTMFLNVDQLQKQLDKDDFQEAGSMAAFWVINRHGTKSEVQDKSNMSENDTEANDAYIRPIYDKELMAEVQLTTECNIFAIGQKHTEQPEFNNEGGVDQYTEKCQEVNSRANIQSHKTRNNNKPVEHKSHIRKPGRQIFTGHRFSPNKSSAVYEKTSPRSCLRWKTTSRIFKSVGLRWIPTGKLFDSCMANVDCEPPHGSNVDISKIHECKQTQDLSADTSINI